MMQLAMKVCILPIEHYSLIRSRERNPDSILKKSGGDTS
jgi:hypothetical protein